MKICPAGDRAVSVEFENEISEPVNREVTSLAAALRPEVGKGIREMVPTYRSLLVCYDPSVLSYDALCSRIHSAAGARDSDTVQHRRIFSIPCCYGGRYGEDLAGMVSITGLSEQEIVKIHSAPVYKVYMLGFLPGFPYLGGMDERIAAPRLKTPRVKIPAGSVGIGGKQTGVYPIDSPGGWRLIGTTPVRFYDPDREQPILCAAGDYIRFCPVTEDEFEAIRKDVEAGTYQPEIREE